MHQVTEKSHAKLGPSGWDRWSQCPGSVPLSEGLPNNSSIYAAEGTVAHELADLVLRGEIVTAADKLGETFVCDGFDIIVDDDMVEHVNNYVEYVRGLAPTDDDILMPEQSVPIGHMTGEPGATGTSDAIVIANGGKLMHVVDFKYGMGVKVDAAGNGQGRMYALGALEKLKQVYDEIEEVEIHIYQPRVEDGITSEVLTIGELEEFRDEVEIAAGRTLIATEEDLNPGEKQCKFCPVGRAAICPALNAERDKALALIKPAEASDFADLSLPKRAAAVAKPGPEISNERLAEFMRAVPLIETAIAGVRGEVERRLFAGETIPGFYLGEGRKGNRKWVDEETAAKAIIKRGRLKKADAYVTKLVSPAECDKLLGKDVTKLLLSEGVIVQSEGKPSVCKEGDKNPPYQISTAQDFADIPSVESEAERLLG